ncbi:MAG: hypothetical protein LBJ92_03590 [Holosporales bacterium]|jgi:hypothetical protein|nr:hypothetical protein [Holosporales bacterium]
MKYASVVLTIQAGVAEAAVNRVMPWKQQGVITLVDYSCGEQRLDDFVANNTNGPRIMYMHYFSGVGIASANQKSDVNKKFKQFCKNVKRIANVPNLPRYFVTLDGMDEEYIKWFEPPNPQQLDQMNPQQILNDDTIPFRLMTFLPRSSMTLSFKRDYSRFLRKLQENLNTNGQLVEITTWMD